MAKKKFVVYMTPPNDVVFSREMQKRFPDLDIISVATKEEMAGIIGETEMMMTTFYFMTQELFDAAKNLKWLHNVTAGIDGLAKFNIAKDIILTSGRGGPMYSVAESTIGLMLAITRDIPQLVRSQQAHEYNKRFLPTLMRGKKVVICGVGMIAETLAPMLKTFQMPVEGLSGRKDVPPGFDAIHPMSKLKEMAAEADFFVILTPLTEETRGLISREVMGAMKPSAYLVNMARGALVDEAALIEILREKKIRGAALDVFEVEPLPASSGLWDLPNVLISPHTGGLHDTLWEDIIPIAADNLTLFLKGETAKMRNQIER